MDAIADTVIPREHNPTTLAYGPEPPCITRVLWEMIIMQLDRCLSLAEGICHEVLAKAAIEEKEQWGYAALVSSSHRIASSTSRDAHS